MLIRNLDLQLVNGSVGLVVGFTPQSTADGTILPVDHRESSSLVDGSSLPVVLFRLRDGEERRIVVNRHMFHVELPSSEVLASRMQVLQVWQFVAFCLRMIYSCHLYWHGRLAFTRLKVVLLSGLRWI